MMPKLIADTCVAWEREASDHFSKLKSNKEELNRIFIDTPVNDDIVFSCDGWDSSGSSWGFHYHSLVQ
jgi:hypothetical protein